MKLDKLYEATKKQLTPARWNHTLRVVDTALGIAEGRAVNLVEVEMAALLHDYCKFWSAEELTSWIQKQDISPEYLSYHKELWHGPVGAEVARTRLGIRSDNVLNAIRFHTTARAEMSELEKIIYLADYIEPARKFPGVDRVRRMVQTDLDMALLQAINQTIMFLIERGQKIFPLTYQARNRLLCMQDEKRGNFV